MKLTEIAEQVFAYILTHKAVKYSLIIGVTLILAMIISRIIRYILNKYIEQSSVKLKTDPTSYKFLKNAVSFIIILIALTIIFVLIPELKSIGLTLFAGAGIFAAIIGFGSQQAFSNIISGIFIVIFKPFRVDDVIQVGGYDRGIVEDITLRHTLIRNFQNRRIVIPNAVISSETIENSSIEEEKICNFLELGISYDSDIDKAIEIMRDEAVKHPKYIDNRSETDKKAGVPAIIVRLIGFGDSSVNLRAYVWTEDHISGFIMKCDLNKSIKKRFDAEGIEIPFPYRTVVFKNPENK